MKQMPEEGTILNLSSFFWHLPMSRMRRKQHHLSRRNSLWHLVPDERGYGDEYNKIIILYL
jgi:hypothetical protein